MRRIVPATINELTDLFCAGHHLDGRFVSLGKH
jgi:hypothetical protein